jgi:hypothetical protein
MKKLPVLIALLSLMLVGACNDQDVAVVEPSADFDFELAFKGTNLSLFPTFELIEIIDKSTDGDTYFWDFGNGETSSEKTPSYFVYSTSGTYTITQTVISSTGNKAVTTKTIKIVDRILRDIELKGLKWNCIGDFPDWSADKTADIYVEILRQGNLFYKSSVVTGVSEHSAPLTIPVGEKVIMNPRDLILGSLIFRLIAIENGKENVIFRSDGSGIGYGSGLSDGLYRINTDCNGTKIYFNSIFQ